jgi:D-alanyl-D-alanine carboxypeptidase/D-alanyl-D-alanine-endopeptidase (penicillin-binding protein 4)
VCPLSLPYTFLLEECDLLELLSAGLISGWLKMAGLPTSLDPLTTLEQPSVQFALTQANSSDRSAEAVITDYLALLKRQGLDPSKQGIWLQSGSTLLANNQGTVAVPAASLTKIATSLAALQTWGVNHQFETVIIAAGQIQNGVLQGNLVIQGGGDPLFVWEEAIALGNALNRIGITRVTGDLVVVGRFMANFQPDSLKAGEFLKKALNEKSWNEEIRAEYAALPKGMAHPQVAIAGNVRTMAELPFGEQTVLVRHRSLPLPYLLKKLNVHSQNEMSQLLADSLGGHQAVIQKATEAARISPDELRLINGSGLGTENQISPHAACAMLAAIDRYLHPLNLTIADVFPASGFDREGTMEDRSMPLGSVIKTGTLNEVSALAGVLPTRDRGLVWFAIVNRGTDILELRNQQDLLLQSLQKQWGVAASAEMIEPSAWVKLQRSTLDAANRNEIVYGG